MADLNRTLFEASFSKRAEESEEEFRHRKDGAWQLANQAISVKTDLIGWPGPEISLTITRAEAEALWDALDSLIPQGEHNPMAPGELGELPLQRLMCFLRTGWW